MFQPSRSLLQCVVVSALSFSAGAVLFAQAQTPEERAAMERVQSSLRRGERGFSTQRGDVLVSPDGNFAVYDLGEQTNAGTRSHAVYDFASKKVSFVRFFTLHGNMQVTSERIDR